MGKRTRRVPSTPAAGDGPSDKELLAQHAAGDPDAFSELVRRHRDRLWAVAVRTLGDREEAADAVQDALVSAYRAAHTFRGQSAVTTWLHRITVNACLDRLRKAKSRRATPVPEPQRLEALLEPHESAAAPAERQDLRRQLRRALEVLPPEQRAALVLVDMQGYPVAEAAEILQIPVGTIKSRCARARARLLPLVSHLNPRSAQNDSPPDTAGRNRTPGTSVPPPRDTGENGVVRGGGGHT
ncbi:RNA polymerase sigma factor SigM [Streptomyces carpaticus]|uniref:RNA polymerase sigma-70 factor, ECF subfamily n=2 Tax=Streptomyces TaxID=1883 RepID=A0A1I6T1M4_9ACTN|nr:MULTISPECIES: RNA polymerase sigma factor SigM [Streptomyces]MCK1816806.1 RNA polymerase sigma factor SigM [Streptomyces sp. XM4011]QKV69756.1 RNA polymerase sigma factor SigM [Streptomyces harbinensis]UWM50157.1 RNA polymerase sigma factor SigM [Streptomyces carpaticus]SFS83181.1 RNA polymerase sigma-70 factor, ECF subfamily [Streptomyces harbinensis]